MSVQYIGQVEQEAGMMVGGHIYGISPLKLTVADIEDAQWATKARPGEGLRFVNIPQDIRDFEFYDVSQGVYETAGGTNLWTTAPSGNTGSEALPGQGNQFFVSGYTKNDGTDIKTDLVVADGGLAVVGAPSKIIPAVRFATNCNYVAMYWTGLPPGKDWLRIDMMRRFNATPVTNIRDITDLIRPKKTYDAKKTFDVLYTLCQNIPIGCHTLKEIDRVIDLIQKYLPNIGHAMQNGSFKQVRTFNEFAGLLQDPSMDTSENTGTTQSQFKRIFPYF